MFQFRFVCLLILTGFLSSNAQIGVHSFQNDVFDEFPYVRDLAISEDGKEMFFTIDDYKHNIGFIVSMRKKRKKWLPPEVASFFGRFRDTRFA